MKFIMFIILFLLIGAFFIISNENIKLNSKENFNLFLKKYGDWGGSLFGNGKTVIGYVAKMEWLPEQNLTDEK